MQFDLPMIGMTTQQTTQLVHKFMLLIVSSWVTDTHLLVIFQMCESTSSHLFSQLSDSCLQIRFFIPACRLHMYRLSQTWNPCENITWSHWTSHWLVISLWSPNKFCFHTHNNSYWGDRDAFIDTFLWQKIWYTWLVGY